MDKRLHPGHSCRVPGTLDKSRVPISNVAQFATLEWGFCYVEDLVIVLKLAAKTKASLTRLGHETLVEQPSPEACSKPAYSPGATWEMAQTCDNCCNPSAILLDGALPPETGQN